MADGWERPAGAPAGSFAAVSRRVAVYDLGSSSFHLLVCDVEPDGGLLPVSRHRATLDLGVALGSSGALPHDRLLAAGRALRRLGSQLAASEPDVVVALGTAALRDAANRSEVLEHLSGAAGTEIRVLAGAEEARLCFAGQLAAVWSPSDAVMVGIDLGGGSLEMAVGNRRGVVQAVSVPVGATRLRGELGDVDPLLRSVRTAIERRVEEELADWPRCFEAAGATTDRVLASGGTVRTLARLATARTRRADQAARASVNQVELPAGQLHELAERLCGATVDERRNMAGMPNRRAPSIAYGAAVMAAAVRHLGIGRLVVSEWGLREGAILDAVFA